MTVDPNDGFVHGVEFNRPVRVRSTFSYRLMRSNGE